MRRMRRMSGFEGMIYIYIVLMDKMDGHIQLDIYKWYDVITTQFLWDKAKTTESSIMRPHVDKDFKL